MTVTPSQAPQVPSVDHRTLANAVRMLAVDAVETAKSGHPGMPLGMADAATVLFTDVLKFDPQDPNWPDRDRLVLSAGHGSMLLYALLFFAGSPDLGLDDLKAFRQWGSKTPGHPERGCIGGVETTTGPLGQGFANAVGMALAERMLNARFGDDLVDHDTYVLASDGDLMEGISHEAASLAGHLRLHRLIVLWDDNHISIDGPTSLAVSDRVRLRFEAYGWEVQEVDGHDPHGVRAALQAARGSDRPSLIACRTTIGFGAPSKAGSEKSHGAPLGPDEIRGVRESFQWPHEPFVIPEAVLQAWRAYGARGATDRRAWEQRLAARPSATRAEFERLQAGRLPDGWRGVIESFKRERILAPPKIPTRKASQDVLSVLTAAVPELIGGSADLTGSNLTLTKTLVPIQAGQYDGRYLFYGVREFAMAAIMNGLALHGGFIPYGGTFLVFSDYMRNALRMAALMKLRVVFVLTHDSIGVGEDGPTHQPIEHLAMLRATPDLTVFRPADVIETAECWELALSGLDGPSVLALTRQPLPTVRTNTLVDNASAQGAYILEEAEGERQVTLIATGSEVSLAKRAREALVAAGLRTALVSMPCWELFDRQPEAYRRRVLGTSGLRVAIEAGSSMGWHRYVGTDGLILALDRFGQSAPGEVLFERFGFTSEAVVAAVRKRLG